MARIPRKLKKDAIAEVIFEVRFTSGALPELVTANLAARWKAFVPQRLPLADVPPSLRMQDSNFKFQPVLELRQNDKRRIVRIGEHVLSYHLLPPYPGWTICEPELNEVIEFVFQSLDGFEASRLGLRYVNVLTADHFISDVRDLNIKVSVADASLAVPINLNYIKTTQDHLSLVRLASKEFVGNPGAGLSALIDIDVFTPDEYRSKDITAAKAWLTVAHQICEHEFFGLFTDDLLDRLEER
jgi:uncharacterized protein (TIGR04255 family)